MIKIVYIIGRLAYGGAEKALLDLCRKINKQKFEITVVVLQEDNPLAEQFEDAGVKVHFMRKKTKFDFSIIKKLAEYLEIIKPDIIHTHLFAADFWGGQAARSAGVKKIISTRHDVIKEDFWRNLLGKRMRRSFNKVIAVSKAIRDYLIKVEKVSLEKVKVIYNGLDISKFYISDPDLFTSGKLRIGSVGRLNKEKGHKHLIRACRLIKNNNWELTLVGDGPLRGELEESVKALGIEEKVKFTGNVSDVRPYLEKMDIFVLPSVTEGLSLAVLEAALSGRIIVATKVGGVPEIVEHEQTGLLFKPKNIEQLVSHINWVDEHRYQSEKMALKLQAEAKEKFDINKIIKKYEDLYENLAGK
ncbi:MAG TPA: glycosyltransferase [Patescibacteria group bacterium]|nr:glycosyltransferase [Patescibacteria group bacterium]